MSKPKYTYHTETLPSLFRKIDAGEIHIPLFQRNFVWGKQQIIQLLDSVYNGLPIGNLLFWRSHEKRIMFSKEDFNNQLYTNKQSSYLYIVDGTQRLRTLYNCLHKKEDKNESLFNIGFNIDKEVFSYLDGDDISKETIAISSIFSHEDIIQHQINLASLENGQTLTKNLNKLISAFVEYQIPIVIIDEVTEDELRTVFERINTTGVSLSEEEIKRASKKTA